MIFSHLTSALLTPPEQPSSYIESVSPVKEGIVCVAICLSITTVIFILRTWARLGVLKQWLLEDRMLLSSQFPLRCSKGH